MKQNHRDTKKLQMEQRLNDQNEFNSISNSFRIENQNQEHNVKKEALGINTKQ